MLPVGPDPTAQQRAAAGRSLRTGIKGTPNAGRFHGRGVRLLWTGKLTGQIFSRHPRIRLPDPNEVGVANVATNEGGQQAPISWDGESSATAPPITKTV